MENDIKNTSELYRENIRNYKVLEAEEVKQLMIKIKNGDLEARKRMIYSNLSLVIWIANELKYINSFLDYNDLIQEGNYALIKAVDNFDPSLNLKFSSYAYDIIRTTILSAVNKNMKQFHVPIDLQIKSYEYDKFKTKILQEENRMPSKEEIMQSLHIDETIFERLLIIEQVVKDTKSLNETIGDTNNELEAIIPQKNNPFKDIENDTDTKILMYKIKQILSPYEYYIIYHRFLKESPSSLRKIGEFLKMSYENVRKVEIKAKEKIKAKILLKDRKESINIAEIQKEELKPMPLSHLIILITLKKELEEYDYFLVYFLWHKKRSLKKVAQELKIDEDKLKQDYQRIYQKYKKLFTSKEAYREEFTKLKEEKNMNQIFEMSKELEPKDIIYQEGKHNIDRTNMQYYESNDGTKRNDFDTSYDIKNKSRKIVLIQKG